MINKNRSIFQSPFDVIIKPLTTEKSTSLQQFNQYSFVVNRKSNSVEIKSAIEKIFKVKVLKVNTNNLRGKPKTFKGVFGYTKDFKKAIVTLAEGNTIDPSSEIK